MQLPFFKTCTKCGQSKLISAFYKNASRPDGLSEYCKACFDVYSERYDSSHPENAKERKHRWYVLNKDRQLSDRKERMKQPEARARQRSYKNKSAKNNPEKRRECELRRRARENEAEGEFTVEEFAALCSRYGNICLCCKESKPLTPDHVIPLSKGGSNWISNIQPLCLSCNSRKKDRTIDYR